MGTKEIPEILTKRNVPLQQTIRGKHFDYNKDQIFYKGDIPSRLGYYGWRICVVLFFLCGGVILGIIPLILLFAPKRIKCLCVSEEGIGCNCYGHGIIHSRFIFRNYKDITSINIVGNNIEIIGNKNKKLFSFNDVLEIEKLKRALQKYQYKITNINKK